MEWYLAYLQSTGTLHGLDLRASLSLRSAGSMNSGEYSSPRSERRRAPRYPYQATLEIEWGSAKLKGQTRDISVGGMFIESDDVLWVGAGFRAQLAIDRPLWLDCSVKRVEPGKGMGVTIALSEEQSNHHFHELLANLAARS